jgi:transmembrane sensor
LKKFPSDGRAGLAAFELGRLRMDRLGDWPGAVQAFERAVQLAPGSGFREDAMARLVTAYAATGRSSDCVRSRDAYLAAFPAGVHRDAVAKGCTER